MERRGAGSKESGNMPSAPSFFPVLESFARRLSMRLMAAVLSMVCSALAFGQRLEVKVLDRQDNETDYSYVVPEHFSSYSNASASCFGSDSSVNCSASGTTNGISTPSHQVSYHVRGATFTLLLPDGRGVIVNCESKFAERMAGPAGNHRSCRIPLVEDIEAEFHKDKAKLEWVVSLDGKKKQSETYKILAILDRPKDGQK